MMKTKKRKSVSHARVKRGDKFIAWLMVSGTRRITDKRKARSKAKCRGKVSF